ncbi:replication gene A protein [Dickeya chrysanthemi Ech1591]|uniref:Replication gene A protein n=1 Tax=Dickeya chrysanthemi (strain Ech1591) TaxID=561229 RepID=C6CMM1_DICC1|nr:replication endonuclease [Dickeya chrysanthemi]ACT05795.1 replication gene A protein [Dickeya chrysanthemi Ech1591]
MNHQYIKTEMESIKHLSPYLFNALKKHHYHTQNSNTGILSHPLLPRAISILKRWENSLLLYLVNLSEKDSYRLSELLASNSQQPALLKIKNELLKKIGKDGHQSARLTSPAWWEKHIKKESDRLKETLLISAGLVQKNVSPFVSREMLFCRQHRQQSRLNFLSNRHVIHAETRQQAESLLTMAMAGIANPRIRKIELTQVLLGTYQYAIESNHICEVVTLTLPPSFHSIKQSGTPCVQWHGLTPKEAHRFLEAYWQKVRSALSGTPIYGTRIVEPHHDATPHWHIIVYMPEQNRENVLSVFKKYAIQLADKFTALDNNKLVTHTSVKNEAILHYLMKYMASSIPGVAEHCAKDDISGEYYADMAERAKLWASLWGIRQFQHFGLPEIGVWRECRRVRSISIADKLGAEAEAVRYAADNSDFAGYIRAQGGAGLKRAGRTLHIAREESPYENLWGEIRMITVGLKCPKSAPEHIVKTRTTCFLQQAVRLLKTTLRQPSSLSCNNVNNCRKTAEGKEEDMPDSLTIPIKNQQDYQTGGKNNRTTDIPIISRI